MKDNESHLRSDRRLLLKTIAAAGFGSAASTGTVSARTSSDGDLDPYHRTLRDHLTERVGLPAGRFVYGTTEEAVLDVFSLQGGSAGTETRVDVSGNVPITMADRVEITEAPSNPYSYTYRADVTGGTAAPNDDGTDATVEEGDVLLAVAYLRSPAGASPETPPQTNAGFKFQYTTPDGETEYSQNYVAGTTAVNPDTEWQRYFFPIEVTSKPEGSEFQPYVEFWTGYSEQTIEFGGVALVDYSGTDVGVDQLPTTDFDYDYPGRADDAAWRERARERIEEVRKADLDVNVVDADGTPVEGATVDVEMQEHDFGFGGEFALSQIADRWDSDVAETYRQTWLENFNKAALTNSLKASPWSGGPSDGGTPEDARRAIQWLLDHDTPTRGHALVWEDYDWMNIDPGLPDARINELVKQRIRTRASEFRGVLPEWDLHNHPIWQSNIRDDLGREAALEWWATGHDAAPDAQMYVNEMNIIAGDSYRDPYDEFISWLMENDAGVGGIGFMGHFGLDQLAPPEELLSVFDRYAEHGVPLQITEFDVQIDDRGDEDQVEVQADYVRDVLTAAFSHEALEGVMSWCFWDRDGDPKRYYGEDWTLRPHGEEYRRLVFEEWWTDASGSTGAGTFQIDFVAGGVEEELGESEDDYYGRQDRLIQYAHAEGDQVTERDTWINSLDPETRRAVTASDIEVTDGTASVSFTVADGEEIELSLAAYTLPGGEFAFDTADEQELVGDATGTFGPGDHTLEVGLPDPGTFTTDAFLGDHEVTVTADGEETTRTVSIEEPSARTVTVEVGDDTESRDVEAPDAG